MTTASLHLLKNVGLIILIWGVIIGAGSPILAALRFRERTHPFLFITFASALGLGVLGHIMFFSGLLGLYSPELAVGLLILGWISFLVEIFRQRRWYVTGLAEARGWLLRQQFLPTGLLLILLLINCAYPLLFNALVPPLPGDGTAYHLAIPKFYIQAGGVQYISFLPFSNWPLEFEMLFTFGLLLQSEVIAQLFTWIALPLISMILIFSGRRWYGDTRIGLTAAVILSIVPGIGTLTGTALIEVPLALFTLLAWVCFIDWTRTLQSRDWILSAIFGGLAASTKMNAALIPLMVGGLMLIVLLLKRPLDWRKAVVRFASYGLIAFLIVLPWYLKTWGHTGNPIWPFAMEIFGARDWDALGNEYFFDFIKKPNLAMTPLNWFTAFYQLAETPGKFGPQNVGIGWTYLLLLLPILWVNVARKFRNSYSNWIILISLISYTSWFFQTHQSRFLIPALPLLSLLGAESILILINLASFRRVFSIAAWSILFIYFSYFSWVGRPFNQGTITTLWKFYSNQWTRDEFLSVRSKGYDAYQYANQYLPKDARVWLALYEGRGYYLDRDYMWANPISQRELKLEKLDSAEELAAELRNRNITHILYNPNRITPYIYIRFGPEITQLVQQTIYQYGELLYVSNDEELELYEIRP